MGILTWILFGLIAGALAKWIMPGPDPGGIFATVILGVAGAVVGGLIGTMLGLGSITGLSVGSFLLAVAGALLLLWIFRRMRRA